MIADRLDCDVHRIEAADPYSADYDKPVQRNVREQDADARPRIANPLDSIDRYATIVLASPIWNVRAPMIMSTFAERHDFSGKTVRPVTTHAMSGLGTTVGDYAQVRAGARIGTGLAVRGEEVRSDGARAIDAWLRPPGPVLIGARVAVGIPRLLGSSFLHESCAGDARARRSHRRAARRGGAPRRVARDAGGSCRPHRPPTDTGVALWQLWQTAEARSRNAGDAAHGEVLRASGLLDLVTGTRARAFEGAALQVFS